MGHLDELNWSCLDYQAELSFNHQGCESSVQCAGNSVHASPSGGIIWKAGGRALGVFNCGSGGITPNCCMFWQNRKNMTSKGWGEGNGLNPPAAREVIGGRRRTVTHVDKPDVRLHPLQLPVSDHCRPTKCQFCMAPANETLSKILEYRQPTKQKRRLPNLQQSSKSKAVLLSGYSLRTSR